MITPDKCPVQNDGEAHCCGNCEECEFLKEETEATESPAPSGQLDLPCAGCWREKERQQLLGLTRLLECHPEEYDGPCECQTCSSY